MPVLSLIDFLRSFFFLISADAVFCKISVSLLFSSSEDDELHHASSRLALSITH